MILYRQLPLFGGRAADHDADPRHGKQQNGPTVERWFDRIEGWMMDDAGDPRAAQILALEQRRRAALIAADLGALEALLDDELIHVHAGGNANSKMQYFSLVRSVWEFMAIERPEIAIRFHGDVAIMTGPMRHVVRVKATREIRTMEAFGTQIWVPHGDSWKQILYQATDIAPH